MLNQHHCLATELNCDPMPLPPLKLM